jgi:predicted metal-dependent phosphotriesterase family hydrolase
MSQVPTVRGPVSSAELGPAYMHEHIFTLTADMQQNYPQEESAPFPRDRRRRRLTGRR